MQIKSTSEIILNQLKKIYEDVYSADESMFVIKLKRLINALNEHFFFKVLSAEIQTKEYAKKAVEDIYRDPDLHPNNQSMLEIISYFIIFDIYIVVAIYLQIYH